MANITYNIVSGIPPFTAQLVPSSIPINFHNSIGEYQFSDVLDGVYLLDVFDSNGCEFTKTITVDSKTLANEPLPDSLTIGNTDDIYQIFNELAINRISHYSGYPNENYVELYIWIKTYNGEPLSSECNLNYTISESLTSNNTFEFDSVSDEIHAEVVETIVGPLSTISGNITLNVGFIETYFKYIYIKDSLSPDFTINIISSKDNIDNSLPLAINNTYGIWYSNLNNIIMKF
jgi:hypothetical protein